MYPDRRGRPSDPRAASNRSLRLSRPLGETRDFLSQAASLLTPASNAAPSTRSAPGIPWQQDPAGSSHRERFNIFRPQVSRQRSRSVSVPRKAKKRKLQFWEHCFCCLASTTQCSPPGPMDRGRLMQAGLGGKTLSIMESADAEDLHHDLYGGPNESNISDSYLLYRTPTYYIGLLLTILDLLTISESYIVYRTPTYYIGVLYNISDSYLLYRSPI